MDYSRRRLAHSVAYEWISIPANADKVQHLRDARWWERKAMKRLILTDMAWFLINHGMMGRVDSDELFGATMLMVESGTAPTPSYVRG